MKRTHNQMVPSNSGYSQNGDQRLSSNLQNLEPNNTGFYRREKDQFGRGQMDDATQTHFGAPITHFGHYRPNWCA
jgi:hypothetical protein